MTKLEGTDVQMVGSCATEDCAQDHHAGGEDRSAVFHGPGVKRQNLVDRSLKCLRLPVSDAVG